MSILIDGLKQYLQDKENELIGGILFDGDMNGQILLFENFGVCTSNSLSLKSEITNHYTEENYWINDHWAINPPQYTLTGLIGELIYTVPNSWAKKVESLYSFTGLGLLSVISPKLGSYTSGVLNITRKIQSVVNKYTNIAKKAGKKILNFLKKDITTKTNQRRVLDELENLMNNRILVNVMTPYGTYTNLAIIAINIRQEQNTKYISEVEITFQKWRNVGEYFNKDFAEKSKSDIVSSQTANTVFKGLVGKKKFDSNAFDETMRVA